LRRDFLSVIHTISRSADDVSIDGDLYGPTRDEAVPGSPATGYIAFKTPSNIPVKNMSVQLKIDAIDYPPYIVN
jgi:hypothetical protein